MRSGHGCTQVAGFKVRINAGRVYLAVTEKLLHISQVAAILQEMRSAGMAVEVCLKAGASLKELADMVLAQPSAGLRVCKQRAGHGLADSEIVFQQSAGGPGERHGAACAALALHISGLLSQLHVLDVEPQKLSPAKAAAIGKFHHEPVAQLHQRIAAVYGIYGRGDPRRARQIVQPAGAAAFHLQTGSGIGLHALILVELPNRCGHVHLMGTAASKLAQIRFDISALQLTVSPLLPCQPAHERHELPALVLVCVKCTGQAYVTQEAIKFIAPPAYGRGGETGGALF
jgi:hypothetical protein